MISTLAKRFFSFFLDIVLEYCTIGEENSISLKDAWMGEIPYSLVYLKIVASWVFPSG